MKKIGKKNKNLCDYSSDDNFYEDILKSDVLRDSTKQTYVYMLKKIATLTKKPLCQSLLDVEITFDILEKSIKSRASLKTIVASVLAVLKWTGEKERNKTLFLKWYTCYSPLLQEIKDIRNNNKPTERQLENWLKWEEVMKAYEKLKKDDYGSDAHLLLAMYCLLKPRRQEDYFKVKLLRKRGDRSNAEESFIDLISEKPFVLVKHFKTSSTYDQWKKELPEELVSIIKYNSKKHDKEYLFMTSKKEPYSNRNSFTKFSNRTFKDIFDKPVTVNTLRHAYSTFRNQDRNLTIGERMEDAKDMGHSLETHLSYALFPQKKLI